MGVQLVVHLFHFEISESENMQRLDLHKQKVHVDTSFIHHVLPSLIRRGRFWGGDNCLFWFLFKAILYNETNSIQMPGFKKKKKEKLFMFRLLLAPTVTNQFLIPPSAISSEHGYTDNPLTAAPARTAPSHSALRCW